MTSAISAGPLIVYGQNPPQAGTNYQPDYNQDLGPSAFAIGTMLIDPRVGVRGNLQAGNVVVTGFMEQQAFLVLDATPATLGTATIAALANVVSGTPMTLVSASGAGIVISTAATLMFPSGITIPAGAVCIDSVPALIAFGPQGSVSVTDPRTMLARAVSITGVVSGTGGVFTVRGYDVHGFAMSEAITVAAGVNTVNGKKAFKVITSVTPAFTDAHTYSVGTLDIFGFPLAVYLFGNIQATWNSAAVTANTGFLAAVTTTATTTTGDVRGTYAVQSASDGTKRLQVQIFVSPWNAGSANGAASLYGVAQA